MAETLLNKNQAGEGIWHQDNLLAGNNISITQVQQPVIDANTLGVWHFDGNFDNAVSSSDVRIDSDGTFSTVYKKFGSSSTTHAGQIDGYSFPNMPTNLEQYTWDAWFLQSGGQFGGQCYFSDGAGFSNFTTSSITINYRTSTDKSLTIQIEGGWHHIAYERIGSVGHIYLDGNLVATQTAWFNNTPVIKYFAAFDTMFMDELRISNVARYQGQNFTPFNQPYAVSGEPAQYQINNTLDISGKQDVLTAVTGFDATKTQVLKNVNGTLTWVDEAQGE